jgi:predicted RND superfamily exporter protein
MNVDLGLMTIFSVLFALLLDFLLLPALLLFLDKEGRQKVGNSS